ncbi:Ig-like domain-containing protein [Cryobacterium sp. W22_MBD10_FK3]|uniref:Ig-like domain-containing protein n=1 Tax=Cryobacterium sp. W22_MBD10_FK3 TaxID=3240273 RepID=UPI003F92CD4D
MAGRRQAVGRRFAPRPRTLRLAAVVTIATLLGGVAIVANGFDVKQTVVDDSSIWALQSGEGNRYARVNTDLGELDTVKTVPSPSTLVQTGTGVMLYAQNNEKVVDVSLTAPVDLGEDPTDYASTPSGTRTVVSSGPWVGYLTGSGGVFTAPAVDGVAAAPTAVDPYADEEPAKGEEPQSYHSDAITIGTDGILYSYSSALDSVLRFDIAEAKVLGFDDVADGPTDDGARMTVIGDTWALLDVAGENLWLRGSTGFVETRLATSAVLQTPSATGDAVYLADASGLVSFALDDGESTREVGEDGGDIGVPAAPTMLDAELYAAWLPGGGAGGTLWNSAEGEGELDYGDATSGSDPQPVFQTNGSRMILNDTQSGWVWGMPDGALILSSLDWGLAAPTEPQQNTDVEEASEVVEPKAPVAEADAFGVRAGQQASLPVLLNDHDANEDVLTIVPDSVTGLPAEFGTLSVTNAGQSLAVQVAADAAGTVTFSYAVTDGSRVDGLNSPPATVTLTVHDDSMNSAPVWCGVEGCLQDWPTVEVQPGGTVSVPLLPGWVDPDGDPIFVTSVVNTSGTGSVSATPSGTLVFKHPNAAEAVEEVVSVTVGVSDVRGAVTDKVLPIQVTAAPALTVRPFALLAAVGEHVTASPAEHVWASAGPYRIEAATLPEASVGSTVTVNAGGATFDFVSTQPGNYPVSLTVADDATEVVVLVRITVLAPESTTLSTDPVTVFVRPKADTSVDVFTAVSNPAGRVLLLSEALPSAAGAGSLDVEIVGQRMLRVRGATADEQPGLLGVVNYTVSDGSDAAGTSVNGQATVYQLAPSVPQPPIALADSVIVRAGAQIDIPVLANDVAPDGNIVVLNADSIQNPSKLGLAFASGSTLRYLAPDQAGVYELRYSVYVAGAAELADSAGVIVTVVAAGENSAPQPRPLTGRVLSGEQIEIPFNSFGIDPDGDDVSLDRVVAQPARGTASVSAAGDAIVYSSVAGDHGAVEFEYRVRDTSGVTGTSLVRIGVLDQRADPRPITFSDYVEVEAGEGNQVIVFPASNDVDPSGGALTLTDVTPDAAADSAEFASLADRIATVEDGQVVLTAGLEPGLLTFVYSVQNADGNTGQGLIVMKVVRASVPDYPVVADTLVSLEERAQFPKGIDVITGRASWASGDVSGLKLSLWGKPTGVTVSGWKISGVAPDDGLLLPFTVSGKNFQGNTVTTYGFLRIPPKDAVILALDRGTAQQNVKEGESVAFDMAALVSVPDTDTLEVGEAVRPSGQRPAAKCSVSGRTQITYTAGAGAPWIDSCTVPVRLAGQADTTDLVVPITVEPLEPQPELVPAALTQSPGAGAHSFELGQMVRWQGEADAAALVFGIDYAGDQFTVEQSGSSLTILAADVAVPGKEEAVTVRLTSHPDVPVATLSLKVGPAPSDLPKGASVATQCSKETGSSCTVQVIGGAGEVNSYASTPLTLVSVASAGTCPGVTFGVADARTVQASWTNDTVGGICQASFVVRDAQGKLSAGARDGAVTIDLQGVPGAPAAVAQTAYNDGSITLAVTPGGSAIAYPALEGFRVLRDGSDIGVTCSAGGECPAITNVTNGSKAMYSAQAFNAVGSSAASAATEAWSYAPPGMSGATATPVYDAGITSPTSGVVELAMDSSDPSTRSYQVNDQVIASTGGRTVTRLTLGVGAQTVQVTPLSRFTPPPISGGSNTSTVSVDVAVAGAPSMSGGTLSATPNSITVADVAQNPNGSAKPSSIVYVAYLGAAPSCTAAADGTMLAPANARTDATMSGLTKNRDYLVLACYGNGFGVAQVTLGPITTWEQPAAPKGYTYQIATDAAKHAYTIQAPTSTERVPDDHTLEVSGFPTDVWGAAPTIQVRYCLNGKTAVCGPYAQVAPAQADRAWQARVDAVTPAACKPGATLTAIADGPGSESATVTVVRATYLIPDKPNPDTPDVIPTTSSWKVVDGTKVPADATQVKDVEWTLSWGGTGTAGLEGYSGAFATPKPCA